MKALTVLQPGASAVTMTSLEIVAFINEDRKAEAEAAGAVFPSKGHAKLDHGDFLKKVPEVLAERAGNFSTTYQVPGPNGAMRSSPGYRFPKREACLMAMSYSYTAQAKVFDRMTRAEDALEDRQALPPSVASQVGGIIKAVVHKEIAAAILELLPAAVQAQLSKQQTSLRSGETAGQVWSRWGLPKLKNGSMVLSRMLVQAGCSSEGKASFGGKVTKIFDPDRADRMRKEIEAPILRYIVERMGQGQLDLGDQRRKRSRPRLAVVGQIRPAANDSIGSEIPVAQQAELKKKAAMNASSRKGKDAA